MFQPAKSDTGAVLPWEYLPAAVDEYLAGQLLNLNASGQLAAIAADLTTKPAYLCMGDVEIGTAGDILPVTRIQDDVIYETTLAEAATGAVVGTKLQVESGGLQASKPATGGGAFEVVWMEGTAAGDVVRGRFVEPDASGSG